MAQFQCFFVPESFMIHVIKTSVSSPHEAKCMSCSTCSTNLISSQNMTTKRRTKKTTPPKSRQAPAAPDLAKSNNEANKKKIGEDEEPEVAELESKNVCEDNHTTCVHDNIDAVLEVFDEITCRDMLIGYYEVASELNDCAILLQDL